MPHNANLITKLRSALKLSSQSVYELPLNKSEDAQFLTLLICLMSFLSVLSFSGTFALNNMTHRWSSGLENKVTIEISPETTDNQILPHDIVQKETQSLYNKLSNHPNIKQATLLGHEDIQNLISPWIGNDLTLADIPLPGLISIDLKNSDPQSIEKLKNDISSYSQQAQLETHNEWFSDLMRFANTLKTLALIIALIVTATTVIAIVAGMKTRLIIHTKEIQLLHNMGAHDKYIARQLERHATKISLKGSCAGVLIGLIFSTIIAFISNQSGTPLIPSLTIGSFNIVGILCIPLMIALIAIISTRITVLRSLAKMP